MYELRIYYEDTDAGGVVYYANYLKYFERARTEHFRELGLDIMDMINRGVYFIVARTEIDFQVSAQLGDILQIETRIIELTKVSVTVDYIVKRKSDKKIVVKGKSKLACINDNNRIMRIPQDIYDKLNSNLQHIK